MSAEADGTGGATVLHTELDAECHQQLLAICTPHAAMC